MKRLVLVAVTAAALAVPATPADAAHPRCQGQRATVVGTEDTYILKGTDARDVIISGGAERVEAKDGDDLVCVTGTRGPEIYAGDGNDIVDGRRGRGFWTAPGSGNDTVLGSRSGDRLWLTGGGKDRVELGSGDDSISITSTSPRSRVALGAGADNVYLLHPHTAVRVDGGPGGDLLEIDHTGKDLGESFVMDNRVGRLRIAGSTAARWKSFHRFVLRLPEETRFSFTGVGRSERVELVHDGHLGSVQLDVDTRGGDDELMVTGNTSGRITLGGGSDELRFDDSHTIDADLEAGTIDTVRPDDLGTTHVDLSGVEDLTISHVPFVEITGDAGANTLVAANACTSVVHGAGGDDRIDVDTARCGEAVVRRHAMYGEGGDDRIVGTDVDDLLDGGSGTDTVDGMSGIDSCYAETTLRCELP